MKMLIALLLTVALQQQPDGPRRAQGSLQNLITESDYPPDALARQAEGDVAVRLTIGPTGKPTDCQVTRLSNDTSLDRRTCEILLERAQFQPALDEAGQPVADSYPAIIVWRLEDEPWPFEPTQVIYTFDITSGRLSRCTTSVNGKLEPPEPVERCAQQIGDALSDMEAVGAEAQLTEVMNLTPAGQRPAPFQDQSFGEMNAEHELELVFDASGGAEGCRLLKQWPIDALPVAEQYALCADLIRMIELEPAPSQTAARKLRVQLRYYTRLGRPL